MCPADCQAWLGLCISISTGPSVVQGLPQSALTQLPGHAGRNFLRCVEGRSNSNLQVVVINDSGALPLHTVQLRIRGVQ